MKLRTAFFYLAFVSGVCAITMHTLYFHQAHERPELRQWLDLSNGLLTLLLCLCVGLVFFKIESIHDVLVLQTLTRKWKLWLLTTFFWLVQIPASMFFYTYRQIRYNYPAEADSIMIPIFEDAFVTMITVVLINLVFWALIWNKKLSQPIFCRFAKYSIGAWLIEIFFTLIIAGFLFALYIATTEGDIGNIPTWLVMLYVSASLRACFVNRQTALEVSVGRPSQPQ